MVIVLVEGTVKGGSQGEREAGVREAVREAAVGTQAARGRGGGEAEEGAGTQA